MIELAVALADGSPKLSLSGVTYGESLQLHKATPKAGYWFFAQTGSAAPYGIRNKDHFSFIAVPDEYGKVGTRVFTVSETGFVYGQDPGTDNIFVRKPEPHICDPAGVLSNPYTSFQTFNVQELRRLD
jgi:hypothetical protein